jgi:histidinol-phosphate aminotransferase
MSMGFPYSRAVSGVLDLTPYQPGKPVEELEREYGIASAIKLASNENPLGPSPLALAALHENGESLARYPDASGFALKAVLADRLGVSARQITLGNGSNDVLDLVARAFVAPGEIVVFSQFALLVYALVTKAVGGVPLVVPAVDWGHDLPAIAESAAARPKLIYLANPNNPTGTYFPKSDLDSFLKRVPGDVLVVLDEAYCEYVERSDYPDGVRLIQQHPNLVVTRTFSKIHGLAGLRIGYAVASEEITDLLNRVRQPFNVSSVAQAAAMAGLEDPDHVSRSRSNNDRQLTRTREFCVKLGLEYIPSVANFLTVKFGEQSSEIYDGLLRKGVIVRPVANYQMPEYLRVTMGRPAEMDALFDALAALSVA